MTLLPRYFYYFVVGCAVITMMNGVLLLAEGPSPEPDRGLPPALVRVGKVERQRLQNHWSVVGRLREIKRSTVASEQEGKVVEADFEEGDPVYGGQTVLARIDRVWGALALRSAQAELGQAEAEVAEAEALLDQEKRDLEQIRGLYESRSINRKELDDVLARVRAQEARLASTHARVSAEEALVKRAEENIARLSVVAPFDGTVVRKMVELGQWVEQGTKIAEIVSRGEIDAVIDVPETMVNNLVLGQPLIVHVDALGIDVEGKVSGVVPLGSNAARTFPVRVRIDDLGGRLKPGMSASADVPMGEKGDFLTVPRDAVVRSVRGVMVWIDAGGMAMPIPVRVLFNTGSGVVVEPKSGGSNGPGGSGGAGRLGRSGGQGLTLHAGMSVVIEGAERLFPTQPLMIMDSEAVESTDGVVGPRAADQ